MLDSGYLWIKAFHVFGFIVWTGAMVGLAHLLRAHARLPDESLAGVIGFERQAAMAMDMAALLAIACGVIMVIQSRPLGEAWAMKQGYFHVKMTLVVLALAAHSYIRIKIGKARRGDRSPVAGWFPPAVAALVLAIVIVAVARPIG